jgi:hypothetical protein
VIATGLLFIQSGSTQGRTPDGTVRLQFAIVLVGTILLVRGLLPMVRARRWRGRACSATGCVVDHVLLGDRHRHVHAPIVEFDVDNTHVRFLGDGVPRDHPLGARVPVLYDPVDPGQARLADLKTVPSWWFIAGLAIVLTGIVAI